MTEIAQNQSQSQQILEVQNNQLQLQQPMQSRLQKTTNETLQQIKNKALTLNDMSYENLQSYLTGLQLYKPQLTLHMQGVKKEIECKEPIKKRVPTTAEKAANRWAAMGIIFVCLSAIITGGAYSISQIQEIQTEWIKLVLIIAVLGVGLFMFVIICKWIWPRRDINQFEKLFERDEN